MPAILPVKKMPAHDGFLPAHHSGMARAACRRVAALVCFAALSAASATAQTASAAPAGPTKPAAPVIRTNANLVLVDVVVTDRDKPVEGLGEAQFHVFENGKEQRITNFEEHRADDALRSGEPPKLPADVYSNYPRFAITSAANVLLLDALNTPLPDQMNVRRQMLGYVKHIRSGTRIAVFTLASRLRMIEGFTTDAAALEAAMARGKGGPEQPVLLQSPQDQDDLNETATLMSSLDGGAMQQFVADSESYQTDQRVALTLDALAQLGRYLATIPGRKNLIWFSGSFPLQIDANAALNPTSGSSPLDPFSPMRNYSEQVKQTDSLLATARVAVYPVDARGLMNLASVDASRGFNSPIMAPPSVSRHGGSSATASGPGMSAAQKADAQFLQRTANELQTMNQIAEETGGKAFGNSNGLNDAIARAIANGSSYYTLGYIPDRLNRDGLFHSIRVQVDGPKRDLAYRRGYYAVDPLKAGPEAAGQVSPIVAALERGAPPLSQIVFEARILPADDPAAKAVKVETGAAGEEAHDLKPPIRRYLVDFAVDPHGITWKAAPGGDARGEIEVSMVAWDGDGKRLNHTDKGFGVNLDPAQSAQVLKSGLPVHQEIDLPAGEVWLRVAVHDLTSGRIGSMEIPLQTDAK